MTKADLIALAERVERAEGPDRELDAEIAPLKGLRCVDEGQPIGRVWYDHRGHVVPLPAFTASLDAAMTLLTEIKGDGMPLCVVGNPETSGLFRAVAATLALALTAASLRAIAEDMD